MSDKVVDPLRVFEFCNTPLKDINGQYRGDCPLCGERSHLFVSKEGKWDCKKCMESGNVYTFIRSWHQSLLTYSPDAYLDLVPLRPGVGKVMLRQSQIAFDGTSWIVPAYSVKESTYKVISLRRWIPETKEMLSCPTLSQGLYIAKWTDNPEGRVWITEGEWDAPKVNKADIAGTMESIKEFLQSNHGIMRAPLAYFIRKAIQSKSMIIT